MAVTEYGVNDALAVKLWSKKLSVEVLKETEIADYMGEDENSLWQIKTETQKGAGDKITHGLRMQLSGAGVQGDGTLEGNEEALTTYSDSIYIDQLRHAVRSAGKMSEQRVPFSVRQQALDGLKDWWVDRIATCAFNQLAGITSQTDYRYTGNQTAIAPTATTNWIYASADHTTEATLDSSDTMDLSVIDRCITLAKTNSPAMRPIMIRGQKHYVLFVHPYQTYQIRTNTSTGQWLDIQKAAIQGGDITKNPIFTGAIGMYNNTIIREDSRVPYYSTYTTTRRAIFCGAQALCVSFGQDNGPGKFTWVEELFDYKNQLGVSAGTIFGVKKTVFNSKDFGTIVVSSYATTP